MRLLDELGAKYSEQLVKHAIVLAGRGNTAALKLVLDRTWVPRRGRPMQLTLPDLSTPAGPEAAMDALISEVCVGNLTVEEAQGVAAMIEARVRMCDMRQLEARLEALETAARAEDEAP